MEKRRDRERVRKKEVKERGSTCRQRRKEKERGMGEEWMGEWSIT